jgi:hypothetical protein
MGCGIDENGLAQGRLRWPCRNHRSETRRTSVGVSRDLGEVELGRTKVLRRQAIRNGLMAERSSKIIADRLSRSPLPFIWRQRMLDSLEVEIYSKNPLCDRLPGTGAVNVASLDAVRPGSWHET